MQWKMLILLSMFLPCMAFANTTAEQTIQNQVTAACQQYDNDSATLKSNPGMYYFRTALCRIKYIHDDKSFIEVAEIFNRSAINNYPVSYFALGMLFSKKYENGSIFYGAKGDPSDLLTAIKDYEAASTLGSSWAQNSLGELYLDDANLSENNQHNRTKDIPDENAPIQLPDINKAIYWLIKAAKGGNPAAQGTLSDLYRQGIGVPQDYVQAYAWQNLSAASQSRFNPRMQNGLGSVLMQGERNTRDELYNRLTDDQKNEAQKLITDYSKKYLIEPSSFDNACLDMQTVISFDSVMKILSEIKN